MRKGAYQGVRTVTTGEAQEFVKPVWLQELTDRKIIDQTFIILSSVAKFHS